MALKSFEALNSRVKGVAKKRVVVAAAHDGHALEAVLAAAGEGIVDYLLVGDRAKIKEIAGSLGQAIGEDSIVDAPDETACAATAVRLIREKKGDFLMKGKLETATLMRAVLHKETGIRTGSTMSHVAILQVPSYHKLLAVTDGGMIPHPTVEQKEMILQNALTVFRALDYSQPKVALLAASETVNERQPETGEAAALADKAAAGAFGDCVVAGPISLDLTISKESADIKGYQSPVTADADILLTPDIASGNLLTKSLLYFGGAVMAGCIVGAKVPIVLTSRGATAEEKRLSILLCAATANQ